MTGILEFLAMGGYALYVWPCYLLTFIVLAINIWLPLRRLRRMQREGQLQTVDPRVRARQTESTS